MVALFSSLLSQINIASFALGRVRTGGVAMSCLNLDTPCTEQMLAEIREIPDIRNVVQVRLGFLLGRLFFPFRYVHLLFLDSRSSINSRFLSLRNFHKKPTELKSGKVVQ